ncbi:MAG TPA: hypothetical protein VF546_18950 [Pyrinomonadaceae bacterium]
MNRSLIFRRLLFIVGHLLFLAQPLLVSQARQDWVTLKGPDGDFTLQMPAAPSKETKVTPQRYFTGQTISIYSSNAGEGYSFTVSYKDLPVRAASVNRQLLLEEYERGLLIDAWSVVGREKLTDGGWQYQAVTPLQIGSLTSPPKACLWARVYFRGARMYTLAVMSRDPNRPLGDAQRFFSSLRFLKAPPASPIPRKRALTAGEMAAARGALRALRRLAAAEEVAPDYDDYGRLLLDVKGEVDDHLSDLGPGEVRDEIELALEAYTDLRVAWNTTKGLLAVPAALYQPQRTLIAKYGIPVNTQGDVPLMDFRGAISAIFKVAREHIERACALLSR